MKRFREIACASAAAAILLVGGLAQAADNTSKVHRILPHTNIRYAMPAVLGNSNFTSDDIAVLGEKGHRIWKGVPFFVHATNGVLKTRDAASSDSTVVKEHITTSVRNAVGVFLLGASEGVGDRDVLSVGRVTYVYDDGSEAVGNVMFRDQYLYKEMLELDTDWAGLEYASDWHSIYSVLDGELVEYNLDVIYHSIPQGNIINIIFEDDPDEGDDSTNSPMWIYGITVATEP